MRRWIILCFVGVLMAFTADTNQSYTAKHISELKNGVLLIRLHEHTGVQKKLLELKQYKRLEEKKKEVALKNGEMLDAFKAHYTFSKYYFFYARNTQKIVAKNFESVVFDTNLVAIDAQEFNNTTLYMLDGETVFFESFGDDQEGYAIYNDSLQLLEKPFPYYIRKRGVGMIRKRTENEMVIKLQETLEKTYDKNVSDELE
jgi:hypothetical protein